MDRDITKLNTSLQSAIHSVKHYCAANNVRLLICGCNRSAEDQARLYRQSRGAGEINRKIDRLKAQGFFGLAHILESVGPQKTKPFVTNAGPGESWHQYGEAFDAVPLVNGKASWLLGNDPREWEVYADAVRNAGLFWAGDWKNAWEFAHAQLRQAGNPLQVMRDMGLEPEEIESVLVGNISNENNDIENNK